MPFHGSPCIIVHTCHIVAKRRASRLYRDLHDFAYQRRFLNIILSSTRAVTAAKHCQLPQSEHLPNSMATAATTPDRAHSAMEPSSMTGDAHFNTDAEKQTPSPPSEEEKSSAFKALGWLDRLLALWILLAMIIGVLLGNFVPETGPALQKGKFVGVSIPIGMPLPSPRARERS